MDLIILSSNLYRADPARLVLHVHQSNDLVGLLAQVSLSPSLVYLTAHPPALLAHIARDYLTPPPPSSTEEKFWGIFIPIRDRPYESINLIHGAKGEGSGNLTELAVEVLVRSSGGSKRRGIPRVLEGWSIVRGEPCELASLESLKGVWRKAVEEVS
jgi:elongator complex protein 5